MLYCTTVIAQPTITLNKYYAYVCQTYKRLKKKPRWTSPNLQADILILEVLNLSAQHVNRCWCPATDISASLWLPATHMAINYLSIPFCYTYAFDMGLPDFSCSNGTHSTWRMGEKMAAFQVNVTNGLASSLLHQHQDSWRKEQCSLYTGCPMPVLGAKCFKLTENHNDWKNGSRIH